MTDRQEEYLLLFATEGSKGRCISMVSEEFGVTKPSVSRVSSCLEQEGLIVRRAYGVIELTKQGWERIRPKLEQTRKLESWLSVALGLPPSSAQQEARRMVARLEPETIARLITYGERQTPALAPEPESTPISGLDSGLYLVPFVLRKRDGQGLSHGDQGFRKPAVLVCSEDRNIFLLSPRAVRRPAAGQAKCDTAMLDRLWYCSREGAWYEARSRRDGSREVPVSALYCEGAGGEMTGTVHIRVRATVSIRKMPESEASLVFDLAQLRPGNPEEIQMLARKGAI